MIQRGLWYVRISFATFNSVQPNQDRSPEGVSMADTKVTLELKKVDFQHCNVHGKWFGVVIGFGSGGGGRIHR